MRNSQVLKVLAGNNKRRKPDPICVHEHSMNAISMDNRYQTTSSSILTTLSDVNLNDAHVFHTKTQSSGTDKCSFLKTTALLNTISGYPF